MAKSKSTPRVASSKALEELGDPQSGALAEAEALADVIEVVSVDGPYLRDHSLATLSQMLNERLREVRKVVEGAAYG